MSPHNPLLLKIAAGKGNMGKGETLPLTWGQLCDRLGSFKRTKETLELYLSLSPDEQGKLKSRPGWWMAAELPDGTRRRASIGMRSAIIFDVDDATPGKLLLLRNGQNAACRFEFAAHSTRKHQLGKPRFRVVFPLKKPIPNDEYEAAARILAQIIDPSMELVDPVSFRKIQMMFWPSCSVDSEALFWRNEGELLDVKKLFEDFEGDPTDYAQLPRGAHEKKARESAAKAQDPTDKHNIVGAFCRTYDVHAAIEKFLPDVYGERDDSGEKTRYSYLYGSATNGVEVQDDGLFIFSHHGTDPCGDKLVNAFDMVREHKFGRLDADVPTDGSRRPQTWPSYLAMVAWLDDDADVMGDPGLQAFDADEEFDDDDVAEPKVDPILAEMLGEGPATVSETDTVDPELDELLFSKPGKPAAKLPKGVEDDVDELIGNGAPGLPVKKKGKLHPIDELNLEYAVVNSGGTAVILHETAEGDVEFLRQGDFGLLYRNKTVAKGQGTIPLADYWLDHPRRRQFLSGVGFWPMRTAPDGYFNLWKGFAVDPDPNTSCDLFLTHLKDVVCSGIESHYDYLIGWLAHMIQRPYEKPGVAVVLKGLKGTGKDTVGDYVGKLFPTNHVKIAQMDQLTGKFNAHFERALLLHAEEAIWAGDRAAHGPLQNAITAPYMRIERKNVDSTQKPNYLRLLLTTNEEWAVPMKGKDERRYFVLLVPATRLQDHAYFSAMWAQGEAGGYAALLHFLKSYDLSKFQVRKVPETTGNADQKLAGLKGEQAFWHEILDNGELPVATVNGEDWTREQADVEVLAFHRAYEQWLKDRPRGGHGQPISAVEMSRRLKKMIEHEIVQRGGKARRASYHVFPSLAECRQRFGEFLGAPILWTGNAGEGFEHYEPAEDLDELV